MPNFPDDSPTPTPERRDEPPARSEPDEEAERKRRAAEEDARRKLGEPFSKREALGEAGLKERGDEEHSS